ncbi:MAG: peptide ABC transporter substrate-binding protein [Chloroflexota bacterium]
MPTATPVVSPHGDTLVFNIGSEPASIDPARDRDTTEDFVDVQLNATLVVPDVNLNMKPGLAASWDLSPDGLTYTFHLRPNLTWSDGSPLTASDFVYSFKRLFHPPAASPYTQFISGIVGARAYATSTSTDPAALAALRAVVGVTAPDDSTLVIRLAQPEAFFLSTLANALTAPVNQANVEKYGAQAFEPSHEVGSGPFILKSWAHNSRMELVPNVYYYGGPPGIDLELAMIGETSATLAAYRANSIDTDGAVALTAADLATVRADAQLRNDLFSYTELGTYFLQYDVAQPPFDSALVRQALGYAIDRRALVRTALAGEGDPAASLVPPGMPGHLPGPGQMYDPNKAKALLALAGYPGGQGLPTNLAASYNNLPTWTKVMQFVRTELQAVGLTIQLNPIDSASYFSAMRQHPSPLFRSGWLSDYPDPNDWYGLFVTGASQNVGQWSNARYDELVRQAAQELNQAKRMQLYNQAAAILMTDPPASWWYHPRRYRLVKPWVRGIVTTGMDGGLPGKYFIKDVTIAFG